MSEPQKRFFQRAIVGWTTKVVKGVECIDRARLSCGHWHRYKRLRPAGSRRSAAPCYECGSGPRTPVEKSRENLRLRTVLQEAIEDPTRKDALIAFVEGALRVTSLHALDPLTERAYEELHRRAQVAGLFGLSREDELEELRPSQTSGRHRGGE